MSDNDKLQLTEEERDAIWFIPQAPGGRVVSEAMQQRLQDLGLATAPREGGLRGITEMGAKAQRGKC